MAKKLPRSATVSLIVLGVAGWWANLLIAHPDARKTLVVLCGGVTVMGLVFIALLYWKPKTP